MLKYVIIGLVNDGAYAPEYGSRLTFYGYMEENTKEVRSMDFTT